MIRELPGIDIRVVADPARRSSSTATARRCLGGRPSRSGDYALGGNARA